MNSPKITEDEIHSQVESAREIVFGEPEEDIMDEDIPEGDDADQIEDEVEIK
jgi:hypothetical protein